MRVAAAGIVAVLASIALQLGSGARADLPSPFPSPSPTASAGPGGGGYAEIAFAPLTASGGVVPNSTQTGTPLPFKSANASGYSLEVLSRISGSYAARLRYRDVSIHGDDNPIASRFDGSIFYTGKTRSAIGLSIGAIQRSNAGTSSNGFGVSAALLPDFKQRISAYASGDFFPSLPAPLGKRGSMEVVELGIVLSNAGQSGAFERLGVTGQTFNPQTTSPVTLWGIDIGAGVSF